MAARLHTDPSHSPSATPLATPYLALSCKDQPPCAMDNYHSRAAGLIHDPPIFLSYLRA
ncbi:hypothetical protein BDW68DRAFT_168540, partial [Aspergillus falconensis]